MENFFLNQSASNHALGAVVFDEESFDGDQVRRGATVKYKIRLRAEQYDATYRSQHGPSYDSSNWLTDYTFPTMPLVGPRGDMYGDPVPGKNEQRS